MPTPRSGVAVRRTAEYEYGTIYGGRMTVTCSLAAVIGPQPVPMAPRRSLPGEPRSSRTPPATPGRGTQIEAAARGALHLVRDLIPGVDSVRVVLAPEGQGLGVSSTWAARPVASAGPSRANEAPRAALEAPIVVQRRVVGRIEAQVPTPGLQQNKR